MNAVLNNGSHFIKDYMPTLSDGRNTWQRTWETEVGTTVQSNRETVTKNYVVDYLSVANHDIMVYEEGSFTQRNVYGQDGKRVSTELSYAEDTERGAPGENIASDTAVRLSKVWYRTSHLDSTLFAVDETGAVVYHAIYDAWGNPLTDTKTDLNYTGLDNRNNYTGYTWDVTLELYFAQNRFYDAENHRFTQEDPVKDGENWYGYVGNGPLNYVDLLGLSRKAYVTPAEGVNLRAGATTASVSLLKLMVDTEVTYLDETQVGGRYTWAKVEYMGTKGWIVYDFLTFEQVIKPTVNPPLNPYTKMYVKADGVRLRKSYSTSSNILQVLNQDTEVMFLNSTMKGSDEYTWAYVDYMGTKGWIADKYLSREKGNLSFGNLTDFPAQGVSIEEFFSMWYKENPPKLGTSDPTTQKPENNTQELLEEYNQLLVCPNLLNSILGAELSSSHSDEPIKREVATYYMGGLLVVRTGIKSEASMTLFGDSSKPVSVFVDVDTLDQLTGSSAGYKFNIGDLLTYQGSFSLSDASQSWSIHNGNVTGKIGTKVDLTKLETGVEISTTTKVNDYQSVTDYTTYSLTGGGVAVLVVTVALGPFAGMVANNAVTALQQLGV